MPTKIQESMSGKYEYLQKVFKVAEFCLELNADRAVIRKTAEAYDVGSTDLGHACTVLKVHSPFLRELVELGFWSFAEAKEQVQQLLRTSGMSLRDAFDCGKDVFEEDIRNAFYAGISTSHLERLAGFLVTHADRRINEFLRSLKTKQEAEMYAASTMKSRIPNRNTMRCLDGDFEKPDDVDDRPRRKTSSSRHSSRDSYDDQYEDDEGDEYDDPYLDDESPEERRRRERQERIASRRERPK